MKPLAQLLSLYNRLMRSHLGFTLLGRTMPALLFGLILGAKTIWLANLLRDGYSGAPGLAAFTHYAIIAYQALVLGFLLAVCLLFVIRLPSRGGVSGLGDVLLGLGGTFSATPIAFAAVTTPNPFVMGAASALMLVGTTLSIVALLHLGRCFGVSAQARGLVTSGPYRCVRHPLYVAEEIATLGVLLPVAAPLTVAVFACHCLLQFLRARREELVLADAFSAYGAYKQRVARFIPGLY